MTMNLQFFGGRGGSASRNNPKEIGDYESATEYFSKEVDKWQKSLTDQELEALVQYTNGEEGTFESINNYLWSGGENYYADDIKALDKAISKFNLNEDIVVYRGTEGADFDLSKGSIITQKGFTSTSTSFETAESYVNSVESEWMEKPTVLKITVPKGKGRAAFVANTATFVPEESEVLLKRNSKLKITGTQKVNGRTVVTATMI